MEKLVEIEGKKIGLKASAGTVCAYRDMFGRDLLLDMGTFEKEFYPAGTLMFDSAFTNVDEMRKVGEFFFTNEHYQQENRAFRRPCH